MADTMVANFFWHGPALGLYERACISSFVKQGITPNIYSFNKGLAVPAGAILKDAAQFASESEVLSYTQGGTKGSIAAFSDIFRYRLFQKEPGWWFDTDIFCLASPAAFKALEQTSPGIVVGREDADTINAAVLYISSADTAHELSRRADEKGKVFDWGVIGPALVSKYVADHPSKANILPPDKFYPVHYRDTDMLFRPEQLENCQQKTQGALCIHLWNEIMRRWSLPQNLLPCRGSYLGRLFSEVGASVDPKAELPLNTLTVLSTVTPAGLKAQRFINQLRPLKERLFGK